MFQILYDKPKPELYPKVERVLDVIGKKGYTKVGDHLLRKGVDFMPQAGMQEMMQTINVDVLFIAGNPMGGKTHGLIQWAQRGIHAKGYGAIIVKKQLNTTKDSAGGILKDAKIVIGEFADATFTSSDNPTFNFPHWGSSISFTHSNFDGKNIHQEREAQEKAKNIQVASVGFDELTDQPFSTFKYYQSRNRDASGIRPMMVATFNTNSHHWTRKMLEYYLVPKEDVHLYGGCRIPDVNKIGKIRYYYMKGNTVDDIIWADTKKEIVDKYDIKVSRELRDAGMTPEMLIKSFTYIPCKFGENRILMHATGGAHVASAFQLGDESRLLFDEDWDAVTEGIAEVGSTMVKNLFTNPISEDTTMYASADVSGGGDNAIMIIWRGKTIIHIESLSKEGWDNPRDWWQHQVKWIDDLLIKFSVPKKNLAFDASGCGGYMSGFTDGIAVYGNGGTIIEVNDAGEKSEMDKFFNLRSQLLGKLSYFFQVGEISCTVDPDLLFDYNKKRESLVEILLTEIDLLRSSDRSGKTYYNGKDEYKSNHSGKSPNVIDAFFVGMRHFLDARPRKEADPIYTRKSYAGLYRNKRTSNNRYYN